MPFQAWGTGDPWLGTAISGGPPLIVPIEPWLGTQGARDLYVPGIHRLTFDKASVDPALFFTEFLRFGGQWNPENTGNRLPIITHETKLRRVSFDRRDIVTVAFTNEELEPANIEYSYEHGIDFGTFRLYTRHSLQQVADMKTELKRILQSMRMDPYGVVPGQGRDWLKVVQTDKKAEQTRKGFYYNELKVEVVARWRPILTARQ